MKPVLPVWRFLCLAVIRLSLSASLPGDFIWNRRRRYCFPFLSSFPPLIAGQGRICMTDEKQQRRRLPPSAAAHTCSLAHPQLEPQSRRGKLAGEDFCIWNSRQPLFRGGKGADCSFLSICFLLRHRMLWHDRPSLERGGTDTRNPPRDIN